MIEGLKVTVKADELAGLCQAQAETHRKKAASYKEKAAMFEDEQSGGITASSHNAKQELLQKMQQHANSASELDFIADHLDPAESYLLDRNDLMQIGVIAGMRGFF